MKRVSLFVLSLLFLFTAWRTASAADYFEASPLLANQLPISVPATSPSMAVDTIAFHAQAGIAYTVTVYGESTFYSTGYRRPSLRVYDYVGPVSIVDPSGAVIATLPGSASGAIMAGPAVFTGTTSGTYHLAVPNFGSFYPAYPKAAAAYQVDYFSVIPPPVNCGIETQTPPPGCP